MKKRQVGKPWGQRQRDKQRDRFKNRSKKFKLKGAGYVKPTQKSLTIDDIQAIQGERDYYQAAYEAEKLIARAGLTGITTAQEKIALLKIKVAAAYVVGVATGAALIYILTRIK